MGSHPPHYHTLAYIKQVTKNYSGLNKFIVAHINTAHETSGSRLNVADKDFANYFKEVFEGFDTENEDFVFMLAGDHGTSKGDFMSIEGLAERVLASHFVIANKELVHRLKADRILRTNTKRAVSRYDWYKTLKALSYAPYTELGTETKEYKEIRTELDSVSLFHEEVDERRTCSDLGVNPVFCISKQFELVPEQFWKTDPVNYFVSQAIEEINKSLKKKCKKSSLKEIFKVEKLSFDASEPLKSTSYLVHFSLSPFKQSYFILYGTQGYSNQYNNMNSQRPYKAFKKEIVTKPKPSKVMISMLWKILRLGPLMTYSELMNTDCGNLMRYTHNLYLGKGSQTCHETCKDLKLECSQFIYPESIQAYVSTLYPVRKVVGEYDSIEVVNNTMVVGRWFSCSNLSLGSNVCFCSMVSSDPWDGVDLSNLRTTKY